MQAIFEKIMNSLPEAADGQAGQRAALQFFLAETAKGDSAIVAQNIAAGIEQGLFTAQEWLDRMRLAAVAVHHYASNRMAKLDSDDIAALLTPIRITGAAISRSSGARAGLTNPNRTAIDDANQYLSIHYGLKSDAARKKIMEKKIPLSLTKAAAASNAIELVAGM